MRQSLNQALRTESSFKLDLSTHKQEALLNNESIAPFGPLSTKRPSLKRNGWSR